MSDAITPFKIAIPDQAIDDLKTRLAMTRWPDQVADTGWRYGSDTAYIKELCAYWANEYDWRKFEVALNRFDQFTTEIDGHHLHFMHVRSKHENAKPLLISHGWPGSVVEFMKIIEPLTDPESHGGSAEDAFHVVCPSLPGYGFSGPTRVEGVDTYTIAGLFAKLMERLGYDSYIAQGGDWGAIITANIGVLDAAHLQGVHVNMAFALPPQGEQPELSEQEQADLAAYGEFDQEETGYQKIQGTKPQTLGVGLMDSPAGLAAWITEKFHTWMDCDGDIESILHKDELLTNISVYWFTGTITSSTRLYYELMHGGRLAFLEQPIEVPSGIARFPKEIMRFPRSWVEQVFSNIRHWQEYPKGGHFAAMEQPQSLVADIRAFARKL
jgi:pimeloyl-ACP methyl ester carboxylesterase